MKKLKKQIKGLGEVSMMGAGMSMGVTALGGSAAPIGNATRHLGSTGTMIGTGHLLKKLKKLGK